MRCFSIAVHCCLKKNGSNITKKLLKSHASALRDKRGDFWIVLIFFLSFALICTWHLCPLSCIYYWYGSLSKASYESKTNKKKKKKKRYKRNPAAMYKKKVKKLKANTHTVNPKPSVWAGEQFRRDGFQERARTYTQSELIGMWHDVKLWTDYNVQHYMWYVICPVLLIHG